MADLGNLFFSLGLKTDQIDAAWKKALEKYKASAQIDIGIGNKDTLARIEQLQRIEIKQNKIDKDEREREGRKLLFENSLVQSKEKTFRMIHDNEDFIEKNENKSLVRAETLRRAKEQTANLEKKNLLDIEDKRRRNADNAAAAAKRDNNIVEQGVNLKKRGVILDQQAINAKKTQELI